MARAQRKLGWMLQNGLGVTANMDEAIGWYQKAAQQGDVQAEINLGWTYTQGDLSQRNYALAEKWMRQAAEQGSADAQYQFGYLLTMEFDKDGHEIRTNFPAAAAWLGKAAEQGHAKAQYQLADMYHSGELGDDQRSNCIPWFLKAAAQGNAQAQAVVGELTKYYPNSELLKSINIETLIKAENREIWVLNSSWLDVIKRVMVCHKMRLKLSSGCKRPRNKIKQKVVGLAMRSTTSL